jgi:type I restriction-modification system DNA methylase subunit
VDYLKEFNNILRDLDHSQNTVTKFSDFLTLIAYSIAQPFYNSQEIEEKYMNTAKKYSKEQLNQVAKMLSIVVSALEDKMHDFLGEVFTTNDMGSNYKGQFFTPYHVSKMMAEIQLTDIDNFKDKEIIKVSEPCSGAGGMIIAFAESLKEKGINYQEKVYVEAIDIDDLCYKMTYIQLSLLGIPAKVIKGNTLSLEFQEALYTPLFFMKNIKSKLNKNNSVIEIPIKQEIKEEIKKENKVTEISQLSLF